MEINRIIEIDADSFRNNTDDSYLKIRYVERTTHPRSRQPTTEPNLKIDLAVLTEALGIIILEAEREGVYPLGEAMNKVITNLQNMYTKTDVNIDKTKIDEIEFYNIIAREL